MRRMEAEQLISTFSIPQQQLVYAALGAPKNSAALQALHREFSPPDAKRALEASRRIHRGPARAMLTPLVLAFAIPALILWLTGAALPAYVDEESIANGGGLSFGMDSGIGIMAFLLGLTFGFLGHLGWLANAAIATAVLYAREGKNPSRRGFTLFGVVALALAFSIYLDPMTWKIGAHLWVGSIALASIALILVKPSPWREFTRQ